MLFKTCVLIALLAFAAIVRAQEEDEEFKAHKQDDDGDDMVKAPLEDRGNYNQWGNGLGGSYRNRGNKGLGSSLRLGGGNLNNLRLGGGSLGRNRGNRGNRGNIEGIEVDVANQVETNKVVPGIVEVAPTVKTESNSVQVVGSTRQRTFRQNSANTVVQNNVVKSTDIHVHTNTLVKKPVTITKIIRRNKTKYIIRTQPVKTNINIERRQEIISPAVKNIVIYQNTESLSRQRLRTQVRNLQRNERLPTIRKATQNEGTEVIGNPINAGSASVALLSNNLGGNRFNNGGLLGGNGNRGLGGLGNLGGLGGNLGGLGGYRGNSLRRNNGGKYRSNKKIYGRANEEAHEEEVSVEPEETKEEAKEETTD